MKKIVLSVATVAALLATTACSTLQSGLPGLPGATQPAATNQQSSNNGALGGMLGSLLNTLVGNAVPLTKQSILGTWHYESPECRFESENFLMQAGGEAGAAAIESKLEGVYSMIGISKGSCSFTFNEDGTCTIQLGRIPLSGTYTLDTNNRTLNFVSNTGLVKINGKVYNSLSDLSILFDAQKLLSLVKTVSTFTGKGSSTLGTVSTLLDSYKGMQLGMNLRK